MISKDINRDQLCLAFRLGLERCQQNLAHLHALIHTGLSDADGVLSAAIVTVIANLEQELMSGRDWLDRLSAA
jgi:hypothetical protein